MNIFKHWVNKPNKEHNFIVLKDNILYRLKSSKESFSKTEQEVKKGIVNDKFIGLPISYLHRVEFSEDENNLKLYYNEDSVDEIFISDSSLRKEIFTFLEKETNPKDYMIASPTFFKRNGKALVPFALLVAFLIYCLSIMDGMKDGYEYIATGIIGALVVGVSNLGYLKLFLIMIPLFGLSLFNLYRKNKKQAEVHTLIYGKPF